VLLELLPFQEFRAPLHCVAAAVGDVDGRRVYLFDYERWNTDHRLSLKVVTAKGSLLATVHPGVSARASIEVDWKSSGPGRVLDAFVWLPPFTVLKAFGRDDDKRIGELEFDRGYLVRAESAEAARAASSPALGQYLVPVKFRGVIEMRPGWVLIGPPKSDVPSEATFRQRLDLAASVARLAPPPATPIATESEGRRHQRPDAERQKRNVRPTNTRARPSACSGVSVRRANNRRTFVRRTLERDQALVRA
jgi:hypothetical protein